MGPGSKVGLTVEATSGTHEVLALSGSACYCNVHTTSSISLAPTIINPPNLKVGGHCCKSSLLNFHFLICSGNSFYIAHHLPVLV